jgi:hypothetical protein
LAPVHRVGDCIADCVWFAVSQVAKRQRIGNQIKTATIICLYRSRVSSKVFVSCITRRISAANRDGSSRNTKCAESDPRDNDRLETVERFLENLPACAT